MTWRALLFLAAAACGASGPPPPATHAHFRAIQRQEAILEDAQRDALETTTACPATCDAVRRGCDAAARICDISASVTDTDAALRCDSGQARCTQYRTAGERCDCGA